MLQVPTIMEFILYSVLKYNVQMVTFPPFLIKHQVINMYWEVKL
jgi:hypothetical protein